MSDAIPSVWTNASVKLLMESSTDGENDPVAVVTAKAQAVALKAMEDGWEGPPFDPFDLAARLGVAVTPRSDVEDARLVVADGKPHVEFNPNRRAARLRFTLAHELAHLLFDDFSDEVRERHRPDARTTDAWQLEMLCNAAAAEFLMPIGSFPAERADDLSLAHLVDLRSHYEVSTEAVLRRAVRLTERPAALFVATRDGDGVVTIDYVAASRAWRPRITTGTVAPIDSVLRRVTAVGFSVDARETWSDQQLHVQALGAPPYAGHRFPRIIGLVEPEGVLDGETPIGITYIRGDATQPDRSRAGVLAHVVNNQARSWGGHGFARALADRHPEVHDDYRAWSQSNSTSLGNVHWAETADGLPVASMVAQAGYGESGRQRLRVGALHSCLEVVADRAQASGSVVHVPLIGTGQGGARWDTVRDLILDDLCAAGVPVNVYVLPEARMPGEGQLQLSLIS